MAILPHRKGWKVYPSFTYPQKEKEIAYVPKRFIELVKEAVRAIDFDSDVFKDGERMFFKCFKKMGLAEALLYCFEDKADSPLVHTHLLGSVGNRIIDYFKKTGNFKYYFPYCNVLVFPYNNNFAVYFDSLLSMSTPSGRMFFPRDTNKVVIGDKEYKVGFSQHAIDRIFERLDYNSDYNSVAYVFDKLSCDFSVCSLNHNGGEEQIALTFYDDCNVDFFSGKYVSNIIGKSDLSGRYEYRVGYCPVCLSNGFAKALTMLTPGMRGTPEYELLMESDMSRNAKHDMGDSINNSARYDRLIGTSDFTALKWFHDNGIPQVRRVCI